LATDFALTGFFADVLRGDFFEAINDPFYNYQKFLEILQMWCIEKPKEMIVISSRRSKKKNCQTKGQEK